MGFVPFFQNLNDYNILNVYENNLDHFRENLFFRYFYEFLWENSHKKWRKQLFLHIGGENKNCPY